MTQRDRVLSMLQAAGDEGVTNHAFLAERLPRFSARIMELRTEGFAIATERLTEGCWLYTLQLDVGPAAVAEIPAPPSGSSAPEYGGGSDAEQPACKQEAEASPGGAHASASSPSSGPQAPGSAQDAVTPDARREVAESGALFELPEPMPQSAVERDWDAGA